MNEVKEHFCVPSKNNFHIFRSVFSFTSKADLLLYPHFPFTTADACDLQDDPEGGHYGL